MRSNTRNSLLIASCVVAFLVCCPALQAIQTITVGNTYAYTPPSGTSPNVGPYSATITPSPGNLLVFCLDGNINGANGSGTLYAFSSLAGTQTAMLNKDEEEAAFLASYDLWVDPTHTAANVNAYDGPIQLAIWYIMGTLPSTLTVSSTVNTAAWAYVVKAQNAVAANPTLFAAGSTFMNSVQIWMPTTGTQRFITVGIEPPPGVPEPSTIVFLGTGLLLLALGRIRLRRQS